MICLSTCFPFPETLDVLRLCTTFSTLGIFLIFMALLLLEVIFHVSHCLMTQTYKTSERHYLMTLKEKTSENLYLCLLKNVHVSICRIGIGIVETGVSIFFSWGSWCICPFGSHIWYSWCCCFLLPWSILPLVCHFCSQLA